MKKYAPFSILLLLLCVLYYPVMLELFEHTFGDSDWSHCLIVPFISVYIAFGKRELIKNAEIKPYSKGILLILLGIGALYVGKIGAELWVKRISLVFFLSGLILYVLGKEVAKILSFPLLFLFFIAPFPPVVIDPVTLKLQFVASRFGVNIMDAFNIPVLREGNLIVLPHTTLEVENACSGLRSLISLILLGIVFIYFLNLSLVLKTVIAFSTIPIAIIANGLRVAGTGLLATFWSVRVAEGFFHTFSGWFIFVVAFLLIFFESFIFSLCTRFIERRK